MANRIQFDDWIGKVRKQHERINTALPEGMSAALDRDDSAPKEGDLLPLPWHWMFFRDCTLQSELGADGLPERGGLMPPVPLPRRMWAASDININTPLCIGETAVKHSEIVRITEKNGKSGRLVFVDLCHKIFNKAGETAIVEKQTIVYTEAIKSGAMPPTRRAPGQSPWKRSLIPDAVLLFRYSALTFNPHRIHYDQPYVEQEEGYPGLVVHGPLIATLMVDLCRRERPEAQIKRFSFRAMAPLFCNNEMVLGALPSEDGSCAHVWVANHEGGLASQGKVTFAS